ncbi:nodulin homeobox isoform X1 [Nymphaea colorata]|nr:nodulin homeobox isoform X1 [Nymphaea colorata]XP_049936063.1 nodulin homeobox isoform X1 [Nymphaea colorata]
MAHSSIIEDLHGINSQELTRLLKESANYTLHVSKGNDSSMQVDIKKLASVLPLHLLAVLLIPGCGDEARLTYLLSGARLLHTLSDLASRHSEIEQILLEDLKTSEQILDLVFFMFVMLAQYEQESHVESFLPLLHSTLVACNLFLLTNYISSQWQDLVNVLLVHPKVDIFMDTAFGAVYLDIEFLRMKLVKLPSEAKKASGPLNPENEAHVISHQCEASLQILMFLCQQKSFRERLLRNKELCRNGGVLSLALAVLKLNVQPHFGESSCLSAVVSRMKSKMLCILVNLCETESISYLDEVASSYRSMHLAKSVALEVLAFLKTAFDRENELLNGSITNQKPKGLVLLNSMRLADIFSDDSNFRCFITINITPILADILSLSHDDFISSWCSQESPVLEEDATVEYEPFNAAGLTILSVQNASGALVSESGPLVNIDCPSVNCIPPASHAQQKTSFLVKIIANLHCFVPNICGEEERNHFFNKFLECLGMEQDISSKVSPPADFTKAIAAYENLCSLLDHAVSLVPVVLLNEDDVQLLSKFVDQLCEMLPQSYKTNATLDFDNENTKKMRENKFKAVHRVHQTSQSWERFSNPEKSKDGQSVGLRGSSLSKKMDDAEDALDYKAKNCDLREGFSDTSLFQEVDQSSVLHKQKSPIKSQTELDRVKNEDQKAPVRFSTGCEKEVRKDGKFVEGNSGGGKKSKNRFDELFTSSDGQFPKPPDFTRDSESKGPTHGNATHGNEKGEAAESEEKQPRKRKRNIMNDKQINLIEKALIEEPDLQRNAVSLQSWTEKLSVHGSELTSSQLKNWLNNRKARLARAAREARAPSEGESNFPDKACASSTGNLYDSSESNGEEYYVPSTAKRGTNQSAGRSSGTSNATKAETRELRPADFPDFVAPHDMQMQFQMHAPMRYMSCEPGQCVCIMDGNGKEVGRGIVYQVDGKWHGKSLDEAGVWVVEISDLKVERWTSLPHPSDSGGTTFDEAEAKNGKMRVAWDANKIFVLP